MCGHDCLGGVCDVGSCQPTTVVTGQSRVSQISTDGTYLYWSGADTSGALYYIARRKVDGSDAVKVLANAETSAGTVAIVGAKVYWMARGHLRSCDAPNCTTGAVDAIATVSAARCGYSMFYAPSKDRLFFGCSANYGMNDGSLWALNFPATTPVTVGPVPSSPTALASDGTNVYWINSSTYTNDSPNADGGAWRVRLSDGVTTQLVPNVKGDVSYLAVGGNALYFTGNIQVVQNPVTYSTAILRAPLPNGLATGSLPKFVDINNVSGMVADDQYLYFTQYGNPGNVSRCAHAGCPTPEVIAPGVPGPENMTQDTGSIYWTTSVLGATTGSIQRLAK